MLPLLRTVMAMRPRTVARGAVPGDRAARRRDRSGGAADPDLLAGRAGAADHLAAGRHQGPRQRARGRFQPRHLPHAGDRPRHDPDALAEASRRRAASSALARRAARAVAGRRGDRRRSRHDPRRRDAGSRHPVGIPVRRPVARPQGRARRLQDRAAESAGDRPRSSSKAMSRSTNTATKAPMATTPATTTRSSASRCSACRRSRCGASPIYLSTFTGRPPDEPSILGEALNEVFIPLLQQQFPEIVDFWLPPEGCSYRIAVVAIRKAYPGHAKRVMMGIWSFLRQFMYTKFVIVVDDDIDARDWKDVMWAISTRMDPVRDMTLIDNTPIDYLDFASPGIGPRRQDRPRRDRQMPPETKREWGRPIRMDRGDRRRGDARNGRATACPARASRSGSNSRLASIASSVNASLVCC